MHADAIRVGCVEAGDVGQCPLTGLLFLRIAFCLAGAFQEAAECFVGRIRIHLFENIVDIREKVASAQPVLPEAPLITSDFCDPDISCLKRFPYLGREPVDKLGAELNRNLANWIASREHSAADAVTRFENGETKSGAS